MFALCQIRLGDSQMQKPPKTDVVIQLKVVTSPNVGSKQDSEMKT